LVRTSGAKIWVGALIQLILSTTFMLIFKFPKIMIVVFGGVILAGTALSSWMKTRRVPARPAPQPPITHPVLFKLLSLIIALCSLAFVCFGLFGFVIFINNWNDWHRYQGQPCHATTFQVTQTYFSKSRRGAIDVYASGMVDGNREWMGLRPYLNTVPRSQEEVDARVPAGTSIPIYLFPQMKGRSRVRVYDRTPTAEAYYHSAMNALNYGLLGLAVCAALVFVLSRLRRMCFDEVDSTMQLMAQS